MPIINTVIAGGGSPTPAPALYREFELNGGLLAPSTTTTHIMSFAGVESIQPYLLYSAYSDNGAISGAVDMSEVVSIDSHGCYLMFCDCTGITSADLSSLDSPLSQACYGMFKNCTGLLSANMQSLKTISGAISSYGQDMPCYEMFSGCTGLTNADLPYLTKITCTNGASGMFQGCTGLTNVVIPSLTILTGYYTCRNMFNGCTNLVSLSFPSIRPDSFGNTNAFTNLCMDIPNITLHFPSNTQAKIETMSGYSTTAPFGAVAGTVLFDLPATNTLTGVDTNIYTRNPKYDTGTALAWKVGAYGTTNFTPVYYTSGTTDPAVSDTIYSDSACTVAVTTIDSIA